MKKTLVLVLIILVAFASGAFALKGNGFAIGAEAASTNFSSWGGMLTLHIPNVPMHFAIGGYFGNNYFGFDLKADYWALHGHMASILDYYVGIGGYASIDVQPDFGFAFGLRLPLGLQVWPLGEILEIFFEIAPAWIPLSDSGFSFGSFCVQPALGFRVWF